MKKMFTIMELLVVVAIIGILVTLTLPFFRDALKNAKRVDCMNNLRQTALAYQIYKIDYESFPTNIYFMDH